MAFTPQRFPISCDIWNFTHDAFIDVPPSRSPDQSNVPCQLAQPLALIVPPSIVLAGGQRLPAIVIIRLPTGTVVGDGTLDNSVSARNYRDLIEVPVNSGNIYGVLSRCTVGQGYVNEHVRCLAVRLTYPNSET